MLPYVHESDPAASKLQDALKSTAVNITPPPSEDSHPSFHIHTVPPPPPSHSFSYPHIAPSSPPPTSSHLHTALRRKHHSHPPILKPLRRQRHSRPPILIVLRRQHHPYPPIHTLPPHQHRHFHLLLRYLYLLHILRFKLYYKIGKQKYATWYVRIL